MYYRFSVKNALSRIAMLLGVVSCLAWSGALVAEPVDLELVLLVDVSGSISDTDFDAEKQAYAAAFRNSRVIAEITDRSHGELGKIAVTMAFWASGQVLAVNNPVWRSIDSAASARSFASEIDQMSRPGVAQVGNQTHIGDAINFARLLFDNNGFEGVRRVIDISGNGQNNGGVAPETARDAAVVAGITINGIVIGDSQLLAHYTNKVIGGAGAFVEQVGNVGAFANGLKTKLAREISYATSSIALSPRHSNGIVGDSYTVTALVTGSDGQTGISGVTVTFSVDSGPNAGITGSDVTDSSGEARFTYSGNGGTGTDTIRAAYQNPTTYQIIETTATQRWVTIVSVLSLTTNRPTQVVRTTHTVTARLTRNDLVTPLVGKPIVFTVKSGPNAGIQGVCSPNADCTTDTNGRASFSYPGVGGIGTDVIEARYIVPGTTDVIQTSEASWINSAGGSGNNGGSGNGSSNAGPRDSDSDGLSDADEARLGTDPNDPDTDNDGLLDGQEAGPGGLGTDPRKRDTDNDGLSDGFEASPNGPETNPLNPDTDGDGLLDGVELGDTPTPTNPLSVDSDGDGRADGVEDVNHNGIVDPGETDPRRADAPGDISPQPPSGGGTGVLGSESGQDVLSGVKGGLGSSGLPFLVMLAALGWRRKRSIWR